ncbi:MAG: DUF305 domain-containing protein [Longimicrobiaceae bacterium]
MKHWSPAPVAAVLLAACGTTAAVSRTTAVQPSSAADAVQPSAAVQADTGRRGYSPADVHFMQGMIGHHAQALEMTSLVADRSRRADLRLLAERIQLSQQSEIAAMQNWLRTRGEPVPCLEPGHQHGGMEHMLMPGMASPEQMARLAAATGAEFDRLFLETMIRHHQGALTMVAELLSTPGSGQEPELFRLASDVDADQRAEIARMEAMLNPR